MALRNNLSNFQETIADPESRMALKEEYLNNLIESFNTPISQITGIVLYAEEKTTESSEIVTAIRVRAKGIHDKFLPDPIAVAKDKSTNTNKFINSCLECHPVVFPEKTQTLGEQNTELYFSARQGDIVELKRNQQGVLMYGRKISKSSDHATMLYDFTPGKADQPGMFVDSTAGYFGNNVKKQVNDYNIGPDGTTNVEWEKKKTLTKELSQSQIAFVEALCVELGKTGWQLKVIVTDLRRTPQMQASIMVRSQRRDPKWWPYHKSWNNLKSIIDNQDYDNATAVRKVKEEIENQMKNGKLISGHLDAMALDIRSKNIGMPNVAQKIQQLYDAVKATGRVSHYEVEYYEGRNYKEQKKLRNQGGEPRGNEHLHVSVIKIEGEKP